MKEIYRKNNLFVARICIDGIISNQLFIIERRTKPVKKVSFRNYISKVKYKTEYVYSEIFTDMDVKLKNDTIIHYLDFAYAEELIPLSNYKNIEELETITKYQLLDIYNKINFKEKEKHLQK